MSPCSLPRGLRFADLESTRQEGQRPRSWPCSQPKSARVASALSATNKSFRVSAHISKLGGPPCAGQQNASSDSATTPGCRITAPALFLRPLCLEVMCGTSKKAQLQSLVSQATRPVVGGTEDCDQLLPVEPVDVRTTPEVTVEIAVRFPLLQCQTQDCEDPVILYQQNFKTGVEFGSQTDAWVYQLLRPDERSPGSGPEELGGSESPAPSYWLGRISACSRVPKCALFHVHSDGFQGYRWGPTTEHPPAHPCPHRRPAPTGLRTPSQGKLPLCLLACQTMAVSHLTYGINTRLHHAIALRPPASQSQARASAEAASPVHVRLPRG